MYNQKLQPQTENETVHLLETAKQNCNK